MTFIGSRPRTREVLQRRMYTHEIQKWLEEAALEEKDGTLSANTNVEPPEDNVTSDRRLI